ncbi:ASCH domain-containing protein [Candidatus Poriferisodalis sp.]|uniref:ASCH domain-containing protein n=1 Tax=Candidatus Poriferisodalis sp. TaxID=3101277 RepID=UPI003B022B49
MAEPRLDPTRALVLSLKPRFAEAILNGTKTLELRRVMPRITIPTLALLYATGPARSLVGTCIVHSVIRLPVDELWQRHGTKTALSRPEFDAYLSGRSEGVALFLKQPNRLPAPIPLQALRLADNFRPPQSLAYVDPGRRERLVTALQ